MRVPKINLNECSSDIGDRAPYRASKTSSKLDRVCPYTQTGAKSASTDLPKPQQAVGLELHAKIENMLDMLTVRFNSESRCLESHTCDSTSTSTSICPMSSSYLEAT